VSCNRLELTGEVSVLEALRYTPAGIPLLSMTLKHLSEQDEAEMKRKVECLVPAIAIGAIAEQSKRLAVGDKVRVAGFIAQRSMKSQQLVLHINTLEII